jgi:hypothetical protein
LDVGGVEVTSAGWAVWEAETLVSSADTVEATIVAPAWSVGVADGKLQAITARRSAVPAKAKGLRCLVMLSPILVAGRIKAYP